MPPRQTGAENKTTQVKEHGWLTFRPQFDGSEGESEVVNVGDQVKNFISNSTTYMISKQVN